MVCVAAFIVLAIISLSLPIVWLFNKRLASSIWNNLTAAWTCVGRRVTFRPCDTSFKQDIENVVLRRALRKNPRLVQPAKVAIEVVAALIIIVTVWSLLTVVKSGLALYVYGTCDINRPSACSLNATEACTIDSDSTSGAFVEWFTDWGELATALPTRMKIWDASKYIPEGGASYSNNQSSVEAQREVPVAVDIFDPGCIVCKQSFAAQKASGFMNKYKVYLIPYSIPSEDGYKFKNSRLVSQYIEAIRGQHESVNEWTIIERLFTGKDTEAELDYHSAFNALYSEAEAEDMLLLWLEEAGLDETEIITIKNRAHSAKIADKLSQNSHLVEDEIKTKRIPTMLYDGKRHEGLFTE